MKRQALLLAIAFLLMLTMCGAHVRRMVTSAPDKAPTVGASAPLPLPEPPVDADRSFKDTFSWFAYGLLSTVTDGDDHGITAQAEDEEGDHDPDRSGSNNDSDVDPDPHQLRARAQFRAPTLPGAFGPPEAQTDSRDR